MLRSKLVFNKRPKFCPDRTTLQSIQFQILKKGEKSINAIGSFPLGWKVRGQWAWIEGGGGIIVFVKGNKLWE